MFLSSLLIDTKLSYLSDFLYNTWLRGKFTLEILGQGFQFGEQRFLLLIVFAATFRDTRVLSQARRMLEN